MNDTTITARIETRNGMAEISMAAPPSRLAVSAATDEARARQRNTQRTHKESRALWESN